jgi:aspartate aminotransferase
MNTARVIDLSLGELGYPPPKLAQLAAARAVAQGTGGYAPMGGLRALRVALADRLRNTGGLAALPEQVVVTNGASQAIFSTLATLCRPGDRVLLPEPGFPLYRLMLASQRLTAVGYPVVETAAGHEPDWEVLFDRAARATVLIWNHPSNPLGTVPRPQWHERLHGLLEQCPELRVISDQVYEDVLFEPSDAGFPAGAGAFADRFVSVFSFSKSHGLAGWRVGYLHATGELASRIGRCHWGMSMSTSTVGQLAALAALREPDYLRNIRESLRGQRDRSADRLRALGLPCRTPPAGFFLWADLTPTGLDDVTWVSRCATECRVLLSAGSEYGPSITDRMRFSFAAAPAAVDDALDRIERWAATGWAAGVREEVAAVGGGAG